MKANVVDGVNPFLLSRKEPALHWEVFDQFFDLDSVTEGCCLRTSDKILNDPFLRKLGRASPSYILASRRGILGGSGIQVGVVSDRAQFLL